MLESYETRKAVNRRYRLAVVVNRLLFILAVLALWEMLSRFQFIDTRFYSRPSLILATLTLDWQTFAVNAGHTLTAVIVSFALASVTAILLGILMSTWRGLGDMMQPFFIFVNSLPKIAMMPLFILLFGISFQTKVATGFMATFFSVFVGTQVGLATVDRELLLIARLLGGTRRQLYFKVALPSAIPAIFGGLRLGVAHAFLGVVASEMVASRNGLGQLIAFYGQTLNAAGVFATLLWMGTMAALMAAAFALLEKRLSRWNGSVS